MTPERWLQVEALYHQALDCSPAERASLLAGTEAELRREVEELLSSPRGESSPLDLSAWAGNTPATTSIGPGTQLGPYEIVALVGKGGMGEVYRAHDTRLRRDVAIKVSKSQFTERFTREARTIASLNHTNICHLYDVVIENNAPNYLVMEYVKGADLKGPFNFDDALPIIEQFIDGIEAAHEKNIIHRDLKPSNIKITPEGVVKILDFGLAKAVGPPSESDPENSLTLTMGGTVAGTILGTPAYMAPEQAKGKTPDKRSDIWSFGVVVYEMLTGKRLFRGGSVVEILGAIVNQDPDISAAPARIHELLRWCLEKDPKQRLSSISDARRILHLNLPAQTPSATIPGSRGRSAAPWLATGVALLALVTVAAWWATQPAQPGTQWSGERLGGSNVAWAPRISPDGQTLAFKAMVDSMGQVAVMKPNSGDWQVLTHDRSRGFVDSIAWSPDSAKLYFSRHQDVPRGIYSVPLFGGEERLVLEDAAVGDAFPDGSLLVIRLNSERRAQLHHYWPENGRLEPLSAFTRNTDSFYARATPDGKKVVFFGALLNQPSASVGAYVPVSGVNAVQHP